MSRQPAGKGPADLIGEADATAPDGFPQAPHGLLHVIRRTDSGDDVCRAVTRWTQKVRLP